MNNCSKGFEHIFFIHMEYSPLGICAIESAQNKNKNKIGSLHCSENALAHRVIPWRQCSPAQSAVACRVCLSHKSRWVPREISARPVGTTATWSRRRAGGVCDVTVQPRHSPELTRHDQPSSKVAGPERSRLACMDVGRSAANAETRPIPNNLT